jgi:predicted HicB family RNase H-like nuclease
MNSADHYSYRVVWSPEDEAYVGTSAEWPSLSWVDTSPPDVFAGIRQLVADVLADMADSGEIPPAPLAGRKYSGAFQVRVPPELHKELVITAAEQHVSLNRLVAARLARA